MILLQVTILTVLSLKGYLFNSLFEDYVFDQSDRSYVGYKLLDVDIHKEYKTYKLNNIRHNRCLIVRHILK